MRSVVSVAWMFAVLAPVAAARQQAPVEVPLQVVDGRLVVPVVAADGSELRFALTTGSATTVLTESIAARLGEGPLTLGGLPIPLEGAATIPDQNLGGGAGGTLDGMVAANMLRDFDILIDAPRGRLVLKTPGRAVSWEGVPLSEPVPLRVLHGIVLSLDVVVSGREYPAMLDIGTPWVVVNPTAGAELGIEGDAFDATLALGPATLESVPARVMDLEVFRRWSAETSGFVLVGAAIARDCAISLSWVHRELRVCAR